MSTVPEFPERVPDEQSEARLVELRREAQRRGPVEHADVVEPQKAPGKHVVAVEVLAIHPPGKVDDELLEAARQEHAVARTAGARHLVRTPARPGVHRRVHVPEVELVGG